MKANSANAKTWLMITTLPGQMLLNIPITSKRSFGVIENVQTAGKMSFTLMPSLLLAVQSLLAALPLRL